MLGKYGSSLSDLVFRIYDLELLFYSAGLDQEEGENKTFDEEQVLSFSYALGLAEIHARELGLTSVLPKISRMKSLDGKKFMEAHHDLSDLRSRIEDELKTRHFLHVLPERTKYFLGKELFGSEVSMRFPKAIDDIEDAGKCVALGQGTACVMHLMRIMEVGLKSLAAALKIPYAPSWESYLRQIQTKIDAKRKTKGVQWKRDEKFFRDVSGDLLTVKQAWRNPTMHIERRYSADEAEEIFKAVRTLMQRLGTKLIGEGGQSS